jgi:hypothetical protein
MKVKTIPQMTLIGKMIPIIKAMAKSEIIQIRSFLTISKSPYKSEILFRRRPSA